MSAIRKVIVEITQTEGYITTFDLDGNEVKVYQPKDKMESDIVNHGYSAPLFIVFGDGKFTKEEAEEYAQVNKIAALAQENGAVIVFVDPKTTWQEEGPGVYENVMNKTKIKQWGFSHGILYDDKKPRNHFEEMAMKNDPHFDPEPEYFIFASPVATYVYGEKAGADYIATHYLKKVSGKASMGDLGFADITMTGVTLKDLSVMPDVEVDDISIVSVNNSKQINDVFNASNNRVAVCDTLDVIGQYDEYLGDYKRWAGKIRKSINYRKEGIIMKPQRTTLAVSPDNHFNGVEGSTHEVAYVLFYDKDLNLYDEDHKFPLLLCFHGGGDTAIATAIIGEWPQIAKKNHFMLCAVEMHLAVTATETMEIVKRLIDSYAIDESRIYATGFSMGGIKSWDFYQEYPDSMAAIAPMCATVDVGENTQFSKSFRLNEDTMVPVFYVGGEESPLAELPFQDQKCVNRIAYTFKLNQVVKPYDVKFEDKEQWSDKVYGIEGDHSFTLHDEDFPDSVTTVRDFLSTDGKCYTRLVSVSKQKHEIRPFTCALAWDFLKQFRRNKDGKIEIID